MELRRKRGLQVSSAAKAKRLEWYRWFPYDYRDTVEDLGLSLAEEGAYRNLLDAAFMRGGSFGAVIW
jgi:hypothetical protein